MNVEEHLLTCLLEECAEVGKDTCKALRFGPDDVDPSGGYYCGTPSDNIRKELIDLLAVGRMLTERGIIQPGWEDPEEGVAKVAKVTKWMEHAKRRRRLTDD